jgi:hypothetical protein
MSYSNSVSYTQSSIFGFKPLLAIRDFFALISASWTEAKLMEQKSHKISGNW